MYVWKSLGELVWMIIHSSISTLSNTLVLSGSVDQLELSLALILFERGECLIMNDMMMIQPCARWATVKSYKCRSIHLFSILFLLFIINFPLRSSPLILIKKDTHLGIIWKAETNWQLPFNSFSEVGVYLKITRVFKSNFQRILSHVHFNFTFNTDSDVWYTKHTGAELCGFMEI